jgi:RNA polymerase subunit RPABC4/transcription elongation factor Spt4
MCKIFLNLLVKLNVLKTEEMADVSIPTTFYMLNKWAGRDPLTSKLLDICETNQEDHHVFLNDDEKECPVCNEPRTSNRFSNLNHAISTLYSLIVTLN